MNRQLVSSRRRWCRVGICAVLAVFGTAALPARAVPLEGGTADALRAVHRGLAGELAQSTLQRPLHLESAETRDGLRGDVYAIVDHSLDEVRAALGNSAQWCEMLILHINNRRCSVARRADGKSLLALSVVRRYDKPIEQAFELSFVHRVVSAAPDYLSVDLSAETGPLGTGNYRVMLEGVPLGDRQTFLHFGYAYDHNMMARLATMAYLATFGSHKVGFTVVGTQPGGEPEHIRGLRGLTERNAMRYFLTLDAYLAVDAAAPHPAEQRMRRWFESIERYPTQLHEVDLETYLAEKRADRQRDGIGAR